MEKAKSEYSPKADWILLHEYEKMVAEKFNLESLMKKLKEPPENQPQNLQAFREIEMGVGQKFLLCKNRWSNCNQKSRSPYYTARRYKCT